MNVPGPAPCQCHSPASARTVSPARICSTGPPRRWTRPAPSVTCSTCPRGCACQAVCAPGAKWTLNTATGDSSDGVAILSSQTVPVNCFAGPRSLSCPPRQIRIAPQSTGPPDAAREISLPAARSVPLDPPRDPFCPIREIRSAPQPACHPPPAGFLDIDVPSVSSDTRRSRQRCAIDARRRTSAAHRCSRIGGLANTGATSMFTGRSTGRRSERWPPVGHHGGGLARRVAGAARLGVAAAVRTGDDLHQVPVRVGEVDAATAVVAVDLAGPGPAGVRPVRHVAPGDPPEDHVELVLADQERVVLGRDLSVGLVEVERDAVVRRRDQEPPEPGRGGQAEDLGEERGQPLLVTARDDGVILYHAHPRPLPASGSSSPPF